MANRLSLATSPYLLQHAENPVEWWEWGEEAFAEARRRDVPVLISVGYAACHWCHVMAHESFEDREVARLVNAEVVAVKVDREERPDVDAVYMTATQAMTGQGGWPMTVFATPEGEPFYCGTYFPREQFAQLVSAVGRTWRERRGEVLVHAGSVAEAVRRAVPTGGGAPLSAELLDGAVRGLRAEFDAEHGGFGGAPKFPPSMVIEFLLRNHARTGDGVALEMVRETCSAMARGGMYDQLAGGFARYSVDGSWTVPHFEKMLYDNALLLRAYTHLWRATGDPTAGRVAGETAAFLLDGLGTEQGGFASALDADAGGVEGATYAWTPGQLREVLGEDDGRWAAELFGVTVAGTFEHRSSVLQLRRDPEPADAARFADVRRRLLAARADRPQPARDDKVVAAWNGLAITALIEYATTALDALATGPTGDASASVAAEEGGRREEWLREVLRRAVGAAELVAGTHVVDGRLRRVSRDGVVGRPAGVLEDYGAVAQAFCAVHQATGDGVWLTRAGELLDVALERFADGDGGFFDTADDAERLVARPADPTDNATPSGLSVLAEALVSYAALAGETRYREAAERALGVLAPVVARAPRFAGHAMAVGEALAAGPVEVAVVGTGPAAEELARVARRAGSPGAVVVTGEPDRPGVPLLAGRPLLAGQPAAYVCRGFVCDRPTSDPTELATQLRPRKVT
jgi:uncharacterized protein YyaL (SSP411 family)